MKTLRLLPLFLIISILSLNSQTQKQGGQKANTAGKPAEKAATTKKDGPVITFEKDEYDFGKIEKGNIAKYQFKFRNTGNQALVIVNVRPSCGCTTPSWSKEPVAPGATGYIEAAYNSNSGHGTFTKSITVTTNIPDQSKVLYIKGEVITPLSEDPAKQTPVRIPGN